MIKSILSALFAPGLKGRLDYHFRPRLRSGFGRPFNGQQKRQQLFLDILEACSFSSIVETGTFRGTTTEFMARASGLPVFTVESNLRFAGYSKARLRRCKSVVVLACDSRTALEQLSRDIATPFFYLDAHWNDDLPLNGELLLIRKYWPEAVVMIDDFRVEGDEGYLYDDYGAGKCLCMDYFDAELKDDIDIFFPRAHSSEESGAKTGCAVLALRGSKHSEALASIQRLWRFKECLRSGCTMNA